MWECHKPKRFIVRYRFHCIYIYAMYHKHYQIKIKNISYKMLHVYPAIYRISLVRAFRYITSWTTPQTPHPLHIIVMWTSKLFININHTQKPYHFDTKIPVQRVRIHSSSHHTTTSDPSDTNHNMQLTIL